MSAPYEDTFLDDGDLCFFAEVPALAHIGQRFDALSESWLQYTAPEDELARWRQLTARLEQLIQQAQRQEMEPWPVIQKQLEQEFGDCLAQACGRVAGPIHEFHESGQMPLAEYLEWILHGAEATWSLSSGAGQGPDMDRFQTRLNRLTARMQEAGYESEMDRRLREEDPERYEFMTKSMELMMDSMNDPDPQAFDNMVVQQMELFRQSPMFDEAQQSMQKMREQLEALRETDPELYQQQVEQFEQTQRFMNDPAAVLEQLEADQPDEQEVDSDEEAELDENVKSAPPGRLLFNCGRRGAVTAEQIALFQQFIDQQEQLRGGIEAALRQLHGWMQQSEPFALPGDRVLFPENPDDSDIPLQCFCIRSVDLHPERDGQIVLDLESQFGHFDEHGCYLSLRNGAVERYGTWDDVFGDDDFDDEE